MIKLRTDIEITGRTHRKGTELAWYKIYPFFMVHMLAFGLSGFFMAYTEDGPGLFFLYMHGGFAIFVYTVFYLAIFGLDRVKWMFINSALGLLGIYAQIDWILSRFGKKAGDYPVSVHVIPFLYYVLYTFLLYQVVLEITGAHKDERRKRSVEIFYVLLSLLVYGWLYIVES